jgi:hypothetical protein
VQNITKKRKIYLLVARLRIITMTNKTKGIALVAIAVLAASLFAATTSLAPMNLYATTDEENDDDDDDKERPALTSTTTRNGPGNSDGNEVESNEKSNDAAVEIDRNRDHNVKQASAAGERALDMERTIETPNKEIKIDVESDDNSQASASKGDSEDTVMANNGGDGGDSEDNDQDANGGDGGDSEDNDQDANGGDAQ